MEFVCRIGTPEGRVVEQVREAHDERSLRKDLEKLGLHLFEARPRGFLSRFRSAGKERGGAKVSMRALLLFNQELAALLRSGLPLLQSLEMMLDRQRDPLFRRILGEVRERVKSGESLSGAFEGFAELFPPLYAPTLQAGERSGELEQVIRRFVRYQRLLLDTRKRVVSALVYPTALIGLSLALIAVMTVYVLPKFTDFFSALKVDLPLLTRVTMGVSLFVKTNLVVIVGVLAAAAFVVSQVMRSQTGRLAADRVKLKVPILGKIFHNMAVSEFCRSLATLLAGGIPVISALEVAIRAVGNLYIRRSLEPIIGRVREGESLALSLDETGVVDEIVIDMVKVGETTGALDSMLTNMSDFLDEEVETSLQRVLSLLEPVMMVLMGIIVATLLVSVYLPIFSLLGQVQA